MNKWIACIDCARAWSDRTQAIKRLVVGGLMALTLCYVVLAPSKVQAQSYPSKAVRVALYSQGIKRKIKQLQRKIFVQNN